MPKINYIDWEETSNKPGVYVIQIGDHRYIGSTSRKIKVRIREHIRLLINNKHYNLKMQCLFNSETTINISVLENCSIEIWKKEQYYINQYIPDLNIVKHVAKYK